MRKRRIGRDWLSAMTKCLVQGNEHRHLRRQPHALAPCRIDPVVLAVLIEAGQSRDRSSENGHGMSILDLCDQLDDGSRDLPGANEFVTKPVELFALRQSAMDQKIGRLLESRMLRQIVN